jgi:RNA polymerase sigma factor (sigma-70 family)
VDLSELTDAALVDRCREGQAAAWSTLVRRYQRLVYTVPRRAGLGDDLAADVFQIAFQRLYESLDRLDDGSRVRAWLVTTAKRETLRLLAERQRTTTGEEASDAIDAQVDPAPLQDAQLAALQDLDRLRQAVDRLAPRDRQFVELLFLQEEPLAYDEIARRLQMAEGSIGPTRARCLAKLRGILAEM